MTNSATSDQTRDQRDSGRPTPSKAPYHGARAADLIYDMQAGMRFMNQAEGSERGAWFYPACYDDFRLVRRRAESLAHGLGIPFAVGLFGADGDAGEVTTSVAISEPGYYAYTLADPRPHVMVIVLVTHDDEEKASDD